VAKLIQGLHHVTATVSDAQDDLDFYAGVLGLRLVKRTVNFDNRLVYHFYYGDELGTPGTIMTTFPYRGMGVAVGRKGAGQIGTIGFSVPPDALDFWRRRLTEGGIPIRDEGTRFGEAFLAFHDPSTLRIELIGADRDPRRPWAAGDVPAERAIRGLHDVTLTLRSLRPSLDLLTGLLGFEVVGEDGPRTRIAVQENAPGKRLDLLHAPDAADALNGLGTVHHVAFGIPNAEHQLWIREKLIAVGLAVTEVRDRQYFRSIYFREPGGVLFEIATLGPGFAVDEDQAELGRSLKLPPWEEPHRGEIEARLPPVTTP